MIFYRGSDGNGDRRGGSTAVMGTNTTVIPQKWGWA